MSDESEVAIGAWLSAALYDPNVCAEMKRDIAKWFTYIGNKPDVHAAVVCDCLNCPALGDLQAKLSQAQVRVAELEGFITKQRIWAEINDKVVALQSKLAEAEATIADQLLTIRALMMGVEEHTGKEGTTPVLVYIARLEARVEAAEMQRYRSLENYDRVIAKLREYEHRFAAMKESDNE